MRDLVTDLRYGLRSLLRTPLLTLAAVLSLALGIGANAAIFSVVHGVLLQPLPYPEPDRVLSVLELDLESGDPMTVSPPNFMDWRERDRVTSAMAAFVRIRLALTGAGDAEQLRALAVTGDFFAALGVPPLLGRPLAAADAVGQGQAVAVLSHDLWTRRFAGDAGILGRSVRLDGEPFTVVGVMPEGFRFPLEGSDVWVPLTFEPDVDTQRGAHYLRVVARLAPGVELAAARADLERIAAALARDHPDQNAGAGVVVEPLREAWLGDLRPALAVLVAAVAVLVLVACANVANLLLAAETRRRRELALRSALGAGRGRLVRQLLTESLLLGLAGSAAALPVVLAGVRFLTRFAPADIPRLDAVGIHAPTLALALAMGVGTGLLVGILPALAAARRDPRTSLTSGGAGERREEGRARRALVAAEVALCVVLLAGGGLLLRSFATLVVVEPGFASAGVLAVELQLPESRYPTAASRTAFYERLVGRTRSLPGVAAAGATFGLPLTGFGFGGSFTVEGNPEPGPGGDEAVAAVRIASPGYFQAMGIPLLEGRPFGPGDRRDGHRVLLASAAAARRFWPAGDALGQRLRFGVRPADDITLEGEIVGIVGDVRDQGLEAAAEPQFYAPLSQTGVDYMTVVLRTATTERAAALAPAVREILREMDPSLPVGRLSTMESVVAESLARRRFTMFLLTAFAALALILAAVGIYGVAAYGVARRTRELGVRVSLGAVPAEISRLVVGQSLGTVIVGLAVGLAGALPLTRLLRSLLYGVGPGDPLTLAGVILVLLAAAAAASYLPARRAARVDPMAALRSE